MIRLKNIDFMCKRKLLIVTLFAFFLSMFISANVTAEMYWKDYNGEDPGGYMPDIDQNQAFKKIRTEETDVGVSLSGTWGTSLDSRASEGSLAHTNDPGASCTFSFTGSSISWIGAKAFNRGQAKVYIDDIDMGTFSQYADDVLWQQVIYSNSSLSSSPQTIEIEPVDTPGFYIDVDAFVVGDIAEHYCAPVAEANSLWWLDKAHGLGIFEFPYDGTGYIGGDINVDGASNVLDLVQDLAVLIKTNVGHTGTTVEDEQAGINAFLAK